MKKITPIAVLINTLIWAALALSLPATATATAEGVSAQLFSGLKTFSGEDIKRDYNKVTHLVFIDLWSSYEGGGDEKIVAALPKKFLQQSQQIWLQAEINVTKAQLTEFQQYFPQVKPLVLDKNFSIMRSLKVWQSPFHVLIRGNKQIFSGDAKTLLAFINKDYSLTLNATNTASHAEDNSKFLAQNKPVQLVKANKPVVGDLAPKFSAKTLKAEPVNLSAELIKLSNNKPLNLVFIDALCPMAQFPHCEAKLAQLNQLIKADASRQWLGVVNSYYVSEAYAQQFAAKYSLKLPLLFDHDNAIFKAYQVYATPYHIKVNRQGLIESRSDSLN